MRLKDIASGTERGKHLCLLEPSERINKIILSLLEEGREAVLAVNSERRRWLEERGISACIWTQQPPDRAFFAELEKNRGSSLLWIVESPENMDPSSLLELEKRLEELCQEGSTVVCIYPEEHPPSKVLKGIGMHRFIFNRGELIENDLYYLPEVAAAAECLLKWVKPEQLLSRLHEKAALDKWLRETLDLYRSLFHRSLDGIAIIDPEGNLMEANQAVFKITGYSREELFSMKVWELLAEEYLPIYRERVRRALKGEDLEGPIVYRIKRKDGTERFLEVSSTPVRSRGRVIGIQAIVRDITDRIKDQERLQRLARQLFTAAKINRLISEELDPDKIPPLVVNLLLKEMNYYNASFWRVEGEEVKLVISKGGFERGKEPREATLKLGQGIIGWVAMKGQPYLAPDVSKDPHYIPYEGLPHVKCEAAVPVFSGKGRVVAVIDVEENSPGAIDRTELEMLSSIASQVSSALENARLFEQIKRERAQVRKLNKLLYLLASAVNSARTVKELCSKVLTALKEVIDCDYAGIMRYDEETSRLIPVSDTGPEGCREVPREPLLLKRRRSSALVKAALSQKPVFIESLREEPLTGRGGKGTRRMRFRQAYIVPLVKDGKLEGLLYVMVEEKKHLSSDDRKLLDAIAEEIAAGMALLKTEEKLRESESRYRAMAENVHNFIALTDTEGRFTYVNPMFETALGYKREELIGKSVFSLVHPEDRKLAEHVFFTQIKKGAPGKVVVRILRADSSIRIVKATGAPIFSREGKLVEVVLAANDITDVVQAEENLRIMKEKLDTIFHAIGDGIFMIKVDDGHYTVEMANHRIKELLGLDPSGKRLEEVLPENVVEPALMEIEKVVMEGRRIAEEAEFFFGKEKRFFYYELVPIMEEGRPAYIVGVLKDITEKKNLERQLLQAQKLEVIGRMAGGIAHDFNNILGVILLETEMLRMEAQEGMVSYLDNITAAVDRAKRLVSQLLSFARKQVLRPEVTDWNSIIKGIEEILKRMMGEKIELRIELEDNPWPIRVDVAQMEQVIMNLAVNARDAMPEGGTFLLKTENVEVDERMSRRFVELAPGKYALLHVEDTGCGIKPEIMEHIFEPFFSTKPDGTGLGLATVYGIVRQHNGAITVDSIPGKGTTFKIYIPVYEGGGKRKTKKGGERKMLKGDETILVVEDNEMLSKVLITALTRMGYKVLSAATGSEALEISESHEGPIHLLISDMVLSDMNGREIAEALKEKYPELKVIFISGYDESAVSQNGVLKEGINFLQKPFTLDVLSKKIREVLDS